MGNDDDIPEYDLYGEIYKSLNENQQKIREVDQDIDEIKIELYINNLETLIQQRAPGKIKLMIEKFITIYTNITINFILDDILPQFAKISKKKSIILNVAEIYNNIQTYITKKQEFSSKEYVRIENYIIKHFGHDEKNEIRKILEFFGYYKRSYYQRIDQIYIFPDEEMEQEYTELIKIITDTLVKKLQEHFTNMKTKDILYFRVCKKDGIFSNYGDFIINSIPVARFCTCSLNPEQYKTHGAEFSDNLQHKTLYPYGVNLGYFNVLSLFFIMMFTLLWILFRTIFKS